MTVSQLISSSCSQPLIKLKSNDLEVPASDTKPQQSFTSTLVISFGTDMLPIKALPPDKLQTQPWHHVAGLEEKSGHWWEAQPLERRAGLSPRL